MMSSGLISGPGRHWPCSSQISTVLLRQFSPPPITCGTFSGWVHDCVSTALTNLKPPTHGPPRKNPPKVATQNSLPTAAAAAYSPRQVREPQKFHTSHRLTKFPKSKKKKRWRTLKNPPEQNHTFFKPKPRGCCMLGSGTKPSPLRKSQYSASLQQKNIGWLMKES